MNTQAKLINLKNLYETFKEEFFALTHETQTERITSKVTPILLRMAKIVVENGNTIKDFHKGENPATITLTNIFQFSSSVARNLTLYVNQDHQLVIDMFLQRKTIKLNYGATLFFLDSITLRGDSSKETFKAVELGTMDISLLFAFNELYNALFNELSNAPLRRG
nr:MAG TPA: hypothetical protein [Caudoviricetes sp.]